MNLCCVTPHHLPTQGPNDYKYMTEVVTKWTDVWSSGSSLDVLPQVGRGSVRWCSVC